MSRKRKYARRAAGAALIGGGALSATKRGRTAMGNWAQLARFGGSRLRGAKLGSRAMTFLRGFRKVA